jgi:hypothetical protein
MSELPQAYQRIKLKLQQKVAKYNFGLHTIGLSKDYIVEDELRHLSKYGAFDEIIIGNGWSNSGILKYIYDDLSGETGVPQLLVTKRKFKSINSGTESSYRGLEFENLLTRKNGPINIMEWSKEDTLLPTDTFNLND